MLPHGAGGRRWHDWQRYLDQARFIFGETGTATNMARRYAVARRRRVAAVPQGHCRAITPIAGRRETWIMAPLVLDGQLRLRRARPCDAGASLDFSQGVGASGF
jgi:hypothetical protein